MLIIITSIIRTVKTEMILTLMIIILIKIKILSGVGTYMEKGDNSASKGY